MPPKKESPTAPASVDGQLLSVVDLNVSDAVLGATLRGILENLGEGEVAAVGPDLTYTGNKKGAYRSKSGPFGPIDPAKIKQRLADMMNIEVRSDNGKIFFVKAGSRGATRRRGKQRLKLVKLVEVQDRSTTVQQPSDADPLDVAVAQAEARGAYVATRLLSSDEMVTATELTDLIGISRQAIGKRRTAGQLLALKGGPKALKYPRWQILPTGEVIPGIKEVLQRVDGDTWTAYRLLKEIAPDGTDRPLYELLRSGDVETVLAHIDGVLGGAGT